MKILLVAINAKFVQTNLAVRLLQSYVSQMTALSGLSGVSIESSEWNINQNPASILRGIYEHEPDMVLFSTYIWNTRIVSRITKELRTLSPRCLIGMGGPEVSYCAHDAMNANPALDLIIIGEGERTLAEMVEKAHAVSVGTFDATVVLNAFAGVRGLVIRKGQRVTGSLFTGDREPITNLDEIPFPYAKGNPGFDYHHRIVYYESSRGCPFSCSYCLSSIDKCVRYYSLERVLRDIRFFLEEGYPLVKFVDRTFNLDPARYVAIWEYIGKNHNGKTCFHFELSAELLSDEAYTVLEKIPENAVQFEIGIQSINPATLIAVGRRSNTLKLAERISRIPSSIHTHVDLIAGLPEETPETFRAAFNYAFSLRADMLQLGFLKVLPGTPLLKTITGINGYAWSQEPPYEILSTPTFSYPEILAVKDIEFVLDAWYNSGLMVHALLALVAGYGRSGADAYSVFRDLVLHITDFYPDGDLYIPRKPASHYECMYAFASSCALSREDRLEAIENLRFDLLLQAKPGAFPSWYERRYSKSAHEHLLRLRDMNESERERPASKRTQFANSEYDEFVLHGNAERILFTYPDKGDGQHFNKVRILKWT